MRGSLDFARVTSAFHKRYAEDANVLVSVCVMIVAKMGIITAIFTVVMFASFKVALIQLTEQQSTTIGAVAMRHKSVR